MVSQGPKRLTARLNQNVELIDQGAMLLVEHVRPALVEADVDGQGGLHGGRVELNHIATLQIRHFRGKSEDHLLARIRLQDAAFRGRKITPDASEHAELHKTLCRLSFMCPNGR